MRLPFFQRVCFKVISFPAHEEGSMSLAWRQKSFAGRQSDIRGFSHGIYPSEEPAANYFRPSFASERAQAESRGVSLHLARFCLQGKSCSDFLTLISFPLNVYFGVAICVASQQTDGEDYSAIREFGAEFALFISRACAIPHTKPASSRAMAATILEWCFPFPNRVIYLRCSRF